MNNKCHLRIYLKPFGKIKVKSKWVIFESMGGCEYGHK